MNKYNGDNINPNYVELLMADIKSGKLHYVDILEIEDCADYLFILQRWDDIKLLIDYCLKIHPDSDEILFIKAKYLIETQHFKKAKDLLDFIAPNYVNDPYYYISYGWLYLKQDLQQDALKHFDKAIELDNEVRYEIAMNLNQLGLHEQVIKYITPVVENSPEDSEAMFEYAFALDKIGRIDEAQEAYEKLVDVSPLYPAAWYNLGIIYNNSGQYDKAVMAYDTAVTVNPDYAEPYFNMGNSYINMMQYDKALDCYFEYASFCDQSQLDTVMQYIGECWWELGNYDYSRRFYERATNAYPDRPELWYGLALANIELGNHTEGLKCLDTAIKLDPDGSEYFFARAQSYYYQEKYDYAYDELMLGIERDPEAVLAWFEAFKIWVNKHMDSNPEDFVSMHIARFDQCNALLFIFCFIIFTTTSDAPSIKKAQKNLDHIAKVSPDTIYMASEDEILRDMLELPNVSKILTNNGINLSDI